jgi:hypothetical protein
MTNIDERAKFEKWAGKEQDPLVFKVSGSGAYVYSGVQAGWEAWQARAAQPTAEVHEYEVVRIMTIAVHPKRAGAEEYAKQLAAYRALSDNGYKVVRK